jgi:hypothetical protein
VCYRHPPSEGKKDDKENNIHKNLHKYSFLLQNTAFKRIIYVLILYVLPVFGGGGGFLQHYKKHDINTAHKQVMGSTPGLGARALGYMRRMISRQAIKIFNRD